MSPETADAAAMRDYFLGQLPDAQVDAIERAYFAKETELDALAAVEDELIDDYLSGRLSPEQRARFESHYLVSDVHVRRVAIARAFRARAAPVRASSRVKPLLAIAAVFVLAVAGAWVVKDRFGDDAADRELRGGASNILVSLIPDRGRLPRQGFVLRWEPGPPGTVYDVEVGTIELKSLSRAFALTAPQYAVPPGALAGLPSGTEIAWRVEATLPNGRSVASKTYLNTLE